MAANPVARTGPAIEVRENWQRFGRLLAVDRAGLSVEHGEIPACLVKITRARTHAGVINTLEVAQAAARG